MSPLPLPSSVSLSGSSFRPQFRWTTPLTRLIVLITCFRSLLISDTVSKTFGIASVVALVSVSVDSRYLSNRLPAH